MARYTIDAVTLLHVFDQELRLDPQHQLVAPSAVRSDVLQLLLSDVRRGGRSEKDARVVHGWVTELKMRVLGDRMSRGTAWRVALEQGWDELRPAEYVAVTRLQADALVTADPELRATVEGLVALAPVEVLTLR